VSISFLKIGFCILFIISCLIGTAQPIDDGNRIETLRLEKYFQVCYDNDFFTGSDYYYTQGIAFKYANPRLRSFFLAKCLFSLGHSIDHYGLSFHQFCYTPTSIASDNILYGDRPFASCLSFTSFMNAIDTGRNLSFQTSLTLGIIGPAALGKEIQSNIHRWVNDPIPKGWQYQVKNDVIINYAMELEKPVLSSPLWRVGVMGGAKLGTLNDALNMGVNLLAGHFNDPCRLSALQKKFQYYLFAQAQGNLIGYDATLQGGIFNRDNSYVISARDLSHLTLRVDAGITFGIKGINFSYHQSFLTKEFASGLDHRWGGLSMLIVL
jgi:lipid A 3-O-deacylase